MDDSNTNRQTLVTLFGGTTFNSPEAEYRFRSESFTAEIPQTGEVFDSREAVRDMQKRIAEPPTVALKRITGEGDFWVVEATQSYEEEGDYHVCVIVEFDNGKIKRETRYYGPPLTVSRPQTSADTDQPAVEPLVRRPAIPSLDLPS